MLITSSDAYPNFIGSAIAAFLIPSFFIAAALAHAGVALFVDPATALSTKWGFAIIGFISFGIVALIYVIYFFGENIRKRSKLAKRF